jgi:hypothetical protein
LKNTISHLVFYRRRLASWLFAGITLVMLGGCVFLAPSRAISNYRDFPLPSGSQNSTFVTVADLAISNSEDANKQFVVGGTGRIQAVAQVRISNPGGLPVRGACRLQIGEASASTTNMQDMTPRSAVWFTTDNAAYSVVVPVIGYSVKGPGTYNVAVQCAQLAFNGGTSAMLDNMVVFLGAE